MAKKQAINMVIEEAKIQDNQVEEVRVNNEEVIENEIVENAEVVVEEAILSNGEAVLGGEEVVSDEEEVFLIGTPNQIEGEHNIFTKNGIIKFTDGKANIKSSVAEVLRQEGLIE
jgi:hypothetical protein